jgi:hypothetical protein
LIQKDEAAPLQLAYLFCTLFASMLGWGIGALYLLFTFVEMSSTSDTILLKQVVVLQIVHSTVITTLETSKRSGGLLQALTCYLLYHHLKNSEP